MDEKLKKLLFEQPAIGAGPTAKILNMGRNSTYQAIAKGELESIRIGRRILVLTGPLRKKLKLDQAS